MIFSIEIRPLALQSLQEAYKYYSSIRLDLGENFLHEVQTFLDMIERNPFVCSYLIESIRQGRIKRFPYNIVYEVSDDKVLVYDIFMAKQNPDKKRTY